MNVWKNFSQIVTLKSAHDKDGRNLLPEDLSIISNATIVFDDHHILWVGPSEELPEKFLDRPSKDFRKKILIPEIVDSHTHTVFGGDRASEYSMRLNGADYQAIANAGGGILSTCKKTNELTHEQLFQNAIEKILKINSYGVGTIEIKSGYGLNFENEYEITHIIHELKKYFNNKIQIFNTYMAAHAVPKNFSGSSQYLNDVVLPLLQKLATEKIIDAVDIFHERNYFDDSDVKRLFKASINLGIPLKCHADEFADNKGAILASKYMALSADHLLMTGQEGIKALASSNTVATLLPGTGFFLGKPQANARNFLDAGCKVAIGSDYNPGSCHCDNIVLLASIAAPTYKMNLAELWSSITLNAAAALGLKNQGAIITGMKPRFSVFDVSTIDQITYNWGRNFCINPVL